MVVRMEGVTSTTLTVITRGNTTRVREVVHTVLRATTIVDSTLINICQGRGGIIESSVTDIIILNSPMHSMEMSLECVQECTVRYSQSNSRVSVPEQRILLKKIGPLPIPKRSSLNTFTPANMKVISVTNSQVCTIMW